jgi:hypothetical protein
MIARTPEQTLLLYVAENPIAAVRRLLTVEHNVCNERRLKQFLATVT